jgi:hypothetical protein
MLYHVSLNSTLAKGNKMKAETLQENFLKAISNSGNDPTLQVVQDAMDACIERLASEDLDRATRNKLFLKAVNYKRWLNNELLKDAQRQKG